MKKNMRTKTGLDAKRTFGAFNQGVIPTIACFNKAKTPLGVNFDSLISAMQVYVTDYVAPVWGTPGRLVKSKNYLKDAWAMVFLDDADEPDALAYHDLTPGGLPLSKVFVKTTRENKELVSVSASHELVEMLVDPAINMVTSGPDLQTTYQHENADPDDDVVLYESADELTLYAYESADPVEALSFKVNGVEMSDFVYPAYFEGFHEPRSVKFDQMGKVKRPFQILAGGYQMIFRDGRWSNLFADKAKEGRFAKEDRRGHRSEARKIGRLLRSS